MPANALARTRRVGALAASKRSALREAALGTPRHASRKAADQTNDALYGYHLALDYYQIVR